LISSLVCFRFVFILAWLAFMISSICHHRPSSSLLFLYIPVYLLPLLSTSKLQFGLLMMIILGVSKEK
jgi:hypothetical protein